MGNVDFLAKLGFCHSQLSYGVLDARICVGTA